VTYSIPVGKNDIGGFVMYYYQYPHPKYYARNVYYPVYNHYFPSYYSRPYPHVDPTVFTESAGAMQNLMKEASIILQKLSESKEFAAEVMGAAQEGKMEKVEQLLKTTGVHARVAVDYTPDGINLKMASDVDGSDCCHLTIGLRWRIGL
jgi:hypothetical protein